VPVPHYLHELDAAVLLPIYRALWHPAIRDIHTAIANSEPMAELAKALQTFRQQHDLSNARIFLCIGLLTIRKNLR